MLTNQDRVKQQIINQTINEIHNHGYQNVSLRKLMRALNLTTGSFYKHFHNENDLILNVAKQISINLYHKIYPDINNYKANPKRSIIKLGEDIINEFAHNKNAMEFLFFNPKILPVYHNKSMSDNFPLLNITKKIISRIVSEKNVDKTFIQLWSFIQGYGSLINNNICKMDNDLMKETLKELIK